MAKAYSLAWFVLLGVLPIIIMAVLYSRVIYSLWIKRERRNEGAQKVFIPRNHSTGQRICNINVVLNETESFH